MRHVHRKPYRIAALVVATTALLVVAGYFDYARETAFEEFAYPLEEDVAAYVARMRRGEEAPSGKVLNEYKYAVLKAPRECAPKLDLVLVVKSALGYFERRTAIRETWGKEDRFPGVRMKTVFVVGVTKNSKDQEGFLEEFERHRDLIQIDFFDSYYNNTIKTMSGFKWLLKNCDQSEFYMFADDDYYISPKNVLNFIQNPFVYPKPATEKNLEIHRFYAGHCVPSRPMRDYFSKYRLSLSEYPYNKFPLYSTAGAYILSRGALEELYYASFFTKHFRFDDVYLGILSRKVGIVPYHSKYFARNWEEGNEDFRRFCIASHGFENTKEMVRFWNEQKELGYA